MQMVRDANHSLFAILWWKFEKLAWSLTLAGCNIIVLDWFTLNLANCHILPSVVVKVGERWQHRLN